MAYTHADLPRPTAKVVPRNQIQTISQAYHYALAGFHATVDLMKQSWSYTPALSNAAALYWDAAHQATLDPPDVARLPSIIGLLSSADGIVATEVDKRTPDASVAAAERVLDTPSKPVPSPVRSAGGSGWPWWAKVAAVVAGIAVGRKIIKK